MIKIELTEDDALLFKAFREHQENFSILYASGVFNIRSGEAILYFNIDGVLDGIEAGRLPIYKRGHKQVQFIALQPDFSIKSIETKAS